MPTVQLTFKDAGSGAASIQARGRLQPAVAVGASDFRLHRRGRLPSRLRNRLDVSSAKQRRLDPSFARQNPLAHHERQRGVAQPRRSRSRWRASSRDRETAIAGQLSEGSSGIFASRP